MLLASNDLRYGMRMDHFAVKSDRDSRCNAFVKYGSSSALEYEDKECQTKERNVNGLKVRAAISCNE